MHDGKEIGRTPTRFISFPPGQVELVLRLPGYQEKVLTQDLSSGYQYANATLIRDRRTD